MLRAVTLIRRCHLCKYGVCTVICVALNLLSAPNIGANIFPVFFLSTA